MTASITEASTRSVPTSEDALCPAPRGAAACRRSGTPSRSATARHDGPETACARIFVSRPAHGQDLRRLLVRHLHAIGVLELLDEREEVERVGLEVLLEPRALVDARRVDVELVGQVRLDEGEDFLAGHRRATP